MRIGLAGLGFMGATHLAAWKGVPGAEIAAVMSNNAAKLAGDLSGVGGNLSGAITQFDFDGITKYAALEAMLADSSLEIIDICLPTHLHVDAAIAAFAANKDVFLEKPMALTAVDADRVVQAAHASGKTFMVGHVLRFFPEYRAVNALLKTSSPVKSAFFRRRCAAPSWSNWLTDEKKSGGAILDLLIHDIDFCVEVWGIPRSIRCTGSQDLSRGIDIANIELQYPSVGPVLITGGWHHPKSYPFAMEFTIVTEEGTLDWKSGGVMTQYLNTGEERAIPLSDADPFQAELAYFFSCLKEGKHPDRCPPKESQQAIQIGELACKSRSNGGQQILCN